MKKHRFAVCIVLLLLGLAGRAPAQSHKTLDQAVGEAAAELSARLPENSRVLIGSIDAPEAALSEYIGGRLASLINANGALTLVERSAEVLQQLRDESDYQRSGLVREETVAVLGEQTGAQIALTGGIVRAGELYALSVRAVDLAGAEIQALYTALVKPDSVLDGLMAKNHNTARPQWVDFPLEYGKTKYENQSAAGPSAWYYDLGISNRTSTEQRARTRARENLQQNIAANIASDFGAYIDILELSAFGDSDVEDVQQIVSRAITNSIRTRLPSFEVLEWHTERGTENGRPWYLAYLLVRFPREDIIRMIEAINPAPVAEEILRALAVPPSSPDRGALLLANLQEARTATVQNLRTGR
jgi:hypothetical protein